MTRKILIGLIAMFLVVILFCGIFFPDSINHFLIHPLSLITWWFIQGLNSIAYQYYWTGLILLTLIILILLIPKEDQSSFPSAYGENNNHNEFPDWGDLIKRAEINSNARAVLYEKLQKIYTDLKKYQRNENLGELNPPPKINKIRSFLLKISVFLGLPGLSLWLNDKKLHDYLKEIFTQFEILSEKIND